MKGHSSISYFNQDLKAKDVKDMDMVEDIKTSVQDIFLSPIQASLKDTQTSKETIIFNDILLDTIISADVENIVEVESISEDTLQGKEVIAIKETKEIVLLWKIKD
ncbi:MAG: hypothetical protein SGBAC_001243 [Bacillariaceae sp.]